LHDLSENIVKPSLRDKLVHVFGAGTLGRSVEAAGGLAVGSVKGPVRKDNQDRAAVVQIARGSSENLTVAAVFDGMGGMADGAAAATLAAATFIADLVLSSGSLRNRLTKAVLQANKDVFQRFAARGGTTLTAIAFDQQRHGCVVHVGDSRLYRQTRERLTLVTTDDTVQGVVQAQSAFKGSEDVLDSQLIQFVGIGPDIEPHLTDVMDSPSAVWLLTSDGAHGLGRQLLEGIATSSGSVGDLVRKLMLVADAASLDDNATVAALDLPRLERTPTFYDGTTLAIWTPSSHIEIWLNPADLRSSPPSPTVMPSDAVVSNSQQLMQAQKPPRKRKKRPGKATSATIEGGRVMADDPTPQLNISFGQRREPEGA
jgi:serine/threonine protein phosphatase PrpC